MAEPFYCRHILHPDEELNQVTMIGPNGWKFILLQFNEPRDSTMNDRCNELAAKLSEIWKLDHGSP